MNPLLLPITLPLSLLYGLVTFVRNKLFDWGVSKELEFEVPIINVGNLALGGTGKTPHIAFLVEAFTGKKVVILSRGYGRTSKGYQKVQINSEVKDVGDEMLMLKMRFPHVPMAVHENRALGIAELLSEHPDTELILLDDAFQHRHVKPRVNILLSEYSKPFFRDFVVPMGRLREYRSGYKRAHLIIFTKCPENAEFQRFNSNSTQNKPTFYSRISYPKLQRVVGREDLIQNPLLVTSIAKPEYLAERLGKQWPDLEHKKFRDHHWFTQKELDELAGMSKHILCTEKDWVKLQELKIPNDLNIWIQAIDIEILGEGLIETITERLS